MYFYLSKAVGSVLLLYQSIFLNMSTHTFILLWNVNTFPPLFNSKPRIWTQVPHLGRGLEPWYYRCRVRKRPQRNLWKDCPHRVWRGLKLNVGDELIMLCIFTALTLIVEQPQEKSSVFSCTPLPRGKCLFPESHNSTDLSATLHRSISNDTVRLERFWFLYFFKTVIWSLLQQFQCTVLQITANASHLADESYAEIQVNKVDTSYASMGNSLAVWPTVTVAQKRPG